MNEQSEKRGTIHCECRSCTLRNLLVYLMAGGLVGWFLADIGLIEFLGTWLMSEASPATESEEAVMIWEILLGWAFIIGIGFLLWKAVRWYWPSRKAA